MNEYYKPAEDLNFVVLSVLAERALFDKARSGDESAKESIIRNHLLLAAKEGRRWARGLLPEDEVISAANFALMKAYEAFDHNRGNRFASFLRPFIRGRMAELWRAQNTVGEHQRKFADKDEQPAGKLQEPVVYQEVEREDHAKFTQKMLEDAKNSVLTEKERAVVDQNFGEERIEMTRIAKQMGLSRERIRQIKMTALAKLRRELTLRMKLAGIER